MAMIRALLAVLVLGLSVVPVMAQSGGDPPPSAALVVDCNGGVTCTLDASLSVDNGPLTYRFNCDRFPLPPGCNVTGTASKVTVAYPIGDATRRTVSVLVTDTIGQTGTMSVSFVPGAAPSPSPTATSTATAPATATATSTSTVIPTLTPPPTDTPTPLPTATSTSTPALCPGVYVGIVVSNNTLTVTCVKATEVPWPDAMLVPSWFVVP